jgi:hypothetical protein
MPLSRMGRRGAATFTAVAIRLLLPGIEALVQTRIRAEVGRVFPP